MTQRQFEYCSQLIWGRIESRDWAENTELFKSKSPQLLLNYNEEEQIAYEKSLKEFRNKTLSIPKVNKQGKIIEGEFI